ncbi:hypothetical protein COW36_00170 [bacterium (Candidatus Blackallbacteria) CG17_big_fil_post_rev_8_21_14_2_50_48_46]|uniref:SMODS-associated and fused to various effectors domain-containing protein n=1 Tax=bacterium (Candidatus Blackallbacteria) CG17_big_fil_post_rev_8_21_14_2_50_48_46 TaxID=2014261 RepID=A0A2M7GBR7_9BACT|nr:MAG: hypothetical protein COW64_08040 [bacterium (Candidatus Blackallbacteria) CG18_big_fil_WC_8_21_14_2_50_49_26]PIW19635.1 MAG: hypothetical protein COW36_00170 [bacterium (Candidatus Blackallbacteria) CG17_big_fil_post_rev_8_21_14_2_50_48_46]
MKKLQRKIPQAQVLLPQLIKILENGPKTFENVMVELQTHFGFDKSLDDQLQEQLDNYLYDLQAAHLIEQADAPASFRLCSDFSERIPANFSYTITALRQLADEKWERPNLSIDLQRQLWGASGGICQMCSDPVWTVDAQHAWTGQIAHIVPFSPYGPRGGNPERSKALKTEFSNLLLLCGKHHKLVDTHRYASQFTEEVLLKIKSEREKRVKKLLSAVSSRALRVLVLTSKIGEQLPKITNSDVVLALSPNHYPEEPCFVSLPLEHTYDDGYFKTSLKTLDKHLDSLIRQTEGQSEPIAVFSIASMPFLIYVGQKLHGNKRPIEPIPFFPDTNTWGWEDDNGQNRQFTYDSAKAVLPENTSDVIVLVNISGEIPEGMAKSAVGDFPCLTFAAEHPGRNIIRQKAHLVEFKKKWIAFVDEIRAQLLKSDQGMQSKIHLFVAVPVTVALEIGRQFQPTTESRVLIYDMNRETGHYYFTLELP